MAIFSKALKLIEKKELFFNAQFWNGASSGDWRFSRIVTDFHETQSWRDNEERHPMARDANNSIAKRKAGDVLRVIRNALAHGNIAYLNRSGIAEQGAKVEFLAFLSRYEEDETSRKLAETYRVAVTTEENFLHFVKHWTAWVARFRGDVGIFRAA